MLDVSLLGRARREGLVDVHVHDLRDFTVDRHRTVDDTPYGGGAGMVMKPEPWALALEHILGEGTAPADAGGAAETGDRLGDHTSAMTPRRSHLGDHNPVSADSMFARMPGHPDPMPLYAC